MEDPRGKPKLCMCVRPALHVFSLSVTDGEGEELSPIRYSIKNRFIPNTGAEMRGKTTGVIIGFVFTSIVVNLSVSVRG